MAVGVTDFLLKMNGNAIFLRYIFNWDSTSAMAGAANAQSSTAKTFSCSTCVAYMGLWLLRYPSQCRRRTPPSAAGRRKDSRADSVQMKFKGPRSWEKRLNHVGNHFAKGVSGVEEKEDIKLREWAIKEGIIVPSVRMNGALASADPKVREDLMIYFPGF
jgi:hypothetical protein